MKEISVIIQTSTRGSDWIQEVHKVAYPSRKRTLDAILRIFGDMVKSGDDPGKDFRSEPEIIQDKESDAFMFKDPEDAERFCRFEIWDPTTCPESLQDDPTLSEWHERFDIETVTLAPDEDDDTESLTILVNREYINKDIRRLGQFMWNHKEDCPKDDIVLDKPVTITRVIDSKSHLDFQEFAVTTVLAGRDDIPMVKGFWQGEEKEDLIALRCHYTRDGRFYADFFWSIGNLISTVITEPCKEAAKELIQDFNDLAVAIADAHGHNVPYTESMDISELPILLMLIVPDEWNSTCCDFAEATLSTCRFLSKNGGILPQSLEGSTLQQFQDYIIENQEHIVSQIQEIVNNYKKEYNQ